MLLQMRLKQGVHLDAEAVKTSEHSVGLSRGDYESPKRAVHLVLCVQGTVTISFKLRESNLEARDYQTHGNIQRVTNGVVVAVDEILQDILCFVAEDELQNSKHKEPSDSREAAEHPGIPGGTHSHLAIETKVGNAKISDVAVAVAMSVAQHVLVRLEVDASQGMHECSSEKSEAPSVSSQAAVAMVNSLVDELSASPCMHVHAKVFPADNDVAAVDEVLADLLSAVDALEA
jgi:hypothetical protein